MYRVQKTTPEFSLDRSTRWHVTDTATGHVLAFHYTRAEATAYVRTLPAPAPAPSTRLPA
jgi:hypothetical protein